MKCKIFFYNSTFKVHTCNLQWYSKNTALESYMNWTWIIFHFDTSFFWMKIVCKIFIANKTLQKWKIKCNSYCILCLRGLYHLFEFRIPPSYSFSMVIFLMMTFSRMLLLIVWCFEKDDELFTVKFLIKF